MVGLPCAWVPHPRIQRANYKIFHSVAVPAFTPFVSSFLLLWRMLPYTSLHLKSPDVLGVRDGFSGPAAAEPRGSQGSSTLNCLPASVLKEIRSGKDWGPCLRMEFFIVKSFAHSVSPSHWAVRAPPRRCDREEGEADSKRTRKWRHCARRRLGVAECWREVVSAQVAWQRWGLVSNQNES